MRPAAVLPVTAAGPPRATGKEYAMRKTLAELQRSPDAGREERTHPVCVAHKAIRQFEKLSESRTQLEIEKHELSEEKDDLTIVSDEDLPSNARVADGPDPRIGEIDTRLAEIETEQTDIDARRRALHDTLEAHTGDVTLRALSPSDWAEWSDKHPPRGEKDPKWNRDMTLAGGWVNADAVIADLHLWAAKWNDEPIDHAAWKWIAESTSGNTLKRLAMIAVAMQEGGDRAVPKSLIVSSMMPADEDD